MSRVTLVAVAALVAGLGGCQREPRSESFFEANPAIRAEVLADCKIGTHGGDECQFAQRAAETAAIKQRRTQRHQELQAVYEAAPAKK